MVKFKEYSKRILCILSVCVCFLVAVFCPFEEFKANESLVGGSATTVTKEFVINDLNFVHTSSNLPFPLTTVTHETSAGVGTYIYFYKYHFASSILTTSQDVYAYKIYATCNSKSVTSDLYINSCLLTFGTLSDLRNDDGVAGQDIRYGSSFSVWYTNDYATDALYVWDKTYCYTSNHSNSTESWNPSLSLTASYTFKFVPYTLNDLTDEIYATLLDIYSTNEEMVTQLENIYTSVDTLETKLQSLVSIAEAIESNTDEVEDLLRVCNQYLSDIKTELEEQTSWLEKIYNAIMEFLGLQGEENLEEAPEDTSMVDLDKKEDELLGNTTPDDAADSLTVELDADSNAFVWNIIDQFVTADGTVFGLYISVLTLGIVALILGR